MDKAKDLAKKNQNKLPFVFLAGAGIAALNTLCRADYNLIIYLYMFYVWKFMENQQDSQAQEKVASFFILLYSLLIDFIWCIFWGTKWHKLENDSESGVHKMVLIFSWIGIILKIVVLILIGVLDWQNIKSAVPSTKLVKFIIDEPAKDEKCSFVSNIDINGQKVLFLPYTTLEITSIENGKEKVIKDEEVIKVLEILEEATEVSKQ